MASNNETSNLTFLAPPNATTEDEAAVAASEEEEEPYPLGNTVWMLFFSIVFAVSIGGNGMVLLLILSKSKTKRGPRAGTSCELWGKNPYVCARLTRAQGEKCPKLASFGEELCKMKVIFKENRAVDSIILLKN